MTNLIRSALAALGMLSAVPASAATAWDFSFVGIDGQPLPLAQYQGKAVLVVNTASQCGFTPQYSGLEALAKKYRERGLVVVGVPSNDFGAQEPGNSSEIKQFCETTFGIDFPLTEKVDVNGDDRHALYAELSAIVDDADGESYSGDIRWNFEKFLIGADGQVIRRYNPRVEPNDPQLIADIAAALA